MHEAWNREVVMKLVLTYVGRIIGLLGSVGVIGAFCALANNESASLRLLHFAWVLVLGVSLIAAGIWLMRRGKQRL